MLWPSFLSETKAKRLDCPTVEIRADINQQQPIDNESYSCVCYSPYQDNK